jgi:two-component system phosphate regulon response regulator PhoB
MNGFEVCKILKRNERTEHIPIVMLTAKGEESDIVTGLELGADDYIVKPFSPNILLARMKSVLRRSSTISTDNIQPIRVHNLIIHPGRREVLLGNKSIILSNLEFKVLYLLSGKPGWVFSRSQIIEGIHDENYIVTDRTIDVIIVGLRKKLGEAGTYIETVRNVGYKFSEFINA